MYDNRLKLKIGGVMRCCIQTLADYEGVGDKEHKRSNGTVLPCKYCKNVLIVKDGEWEWYEEYKK